MTPIDTNHDSLGIYYDFLEESDFDTNDFRESLISQKSSHWIHQYLYRDVGGGIDEVGYYGDVGAEYGYVGGCYGNSVGSDVNSHYRNSIIGIYVGVVGGRNLL